jgi:hypothetical protein
MYRLGIVYILNDDTLSPVFNLRGCNFDICNSNLDREDSKLKNLYIDKINNKKNYLERDAFLSNGLYLDNTMGVFKNPKKSIYSGWNSDKGTFPLYYQISISSEIMHELNKCYVKGYFIVRQKRIPTILAQGLSVGIDQTSYIPMLRTQTHILDYSAESFLDKSRILTSSYNGRILHSTSSQSSALLCLDANVSPMLQSMLDGSLYTLESVAELSSVGTIPNNPRHFYVNF